MNLKTILIAFVLLFLAFFTRYTSYLDTRILEGRQNLAFQTMGTGGDPDYQMRCGLQFSQGQPNEALTHYDYIFLCPYMGLVFMTNTLINGLELIVFINILIGSVVSITPFLLLAYLNKNTIGGIITSLILIFNPTMIQNADGRFYIYPLVTFFFTLFYICLFFAIKTKNIGWLILLGIMGILHDLNKPFMYTNDLILFIALPFLLLVKKTSFIKKFPYISFSFHKESIYKIFIPTTIYFIGIISYEFIHTYFTNAYFFLSDLFIDTGGPSSKDFILKESLAFPGSKLQQFKNILSLIFKGTRLLLELIPNSFFWLLTAIMLYIVSQRKLVNIAVVIGAIILLTVIQLQVVTLFLTPNIYVPLGEIPLNEYILISLFIVFICIFSFKSIFNMSFTFLHFFYFGALCMTLAATTQPQLFVTLIIWFSLLIGIYIDQQLFPMLNHFAKRIYIIIFVILLLPFFNTYIILKDGMQRLQKLPKEISYLQWVDKKIPHDSFIIGGASDSLILLSRYTDNNIIYNGFYVASVIKHNARGDELYEFKSYPDFVEETMKAGKVKLIILDHDYSLWYNYLNTGATETYPIFAYKLTEYAESKELGRKIYTLELNTK